MSPATGGLVTVRNSEKGTEMNSKTLSWLVAAAIAAVPVAILATSVAPLVSSVVTTWQTLNGRL